MNTRALRRNFIAKSIPVAEARFLEIGAMDSPTFPGPEVDVTYLDWFSREELLERHGDNPRRKPEAMVQVDHVVKGKRFGQQISDRFDAVIANHVLEHVPDPITWLQQIEAVTVDAAALFLSVPDRNYTFDYLRPESTFVDLLRAYHQDLDRADYYQVLSGLLYHRPIRAKDAWSGDLAEKLAHARFSVPRAMEKAEELSSTYSDVHCHVFSRASFEPLWTDLAASGLVGWKLVDIDDVERDQNEFHALLRKPA